MDFNAFITSYGDVLEWVAGSVIALALLIGIFRMLRPIRNALKRLL